VPHSDLSSRAALHAVSLLLDRVRELERARLEREERLELWPIEELPIEGDDASRAAWRTCENRAQIAPTSASVPITGEAH
jgi:hypothetical protein